MKKLLRNRPKLTRTPAPVKNLKQAAVIGIIFALIWSFGPVVGTQYTTVLQILSVVIAAILFLSLIILQKHAPKSTETSKGLPDSYYTLIMVEALLIAVGVFLFKSSANTPYLIAWISAVVGLHFCALSYILHVRRQIFTGIAIIISAIVGASLWATGSTVAVSRNTTSFATAFILLASAEIAINEIRKRQHDKRVTQAS